ncbi:MAG: hypothetical protein LBB07_00660 [Bifidobacteriaceae bacterium]|jgi:exonuclease VII small subunit|nr:hypothetical protein [Bifidobacteriaceae bacterium]
MINKLREMVSKSVVTRSEFEVEVRYLREKIMELEKRNKELEDVILSFGNDHQRVAELYNALSKKI